MKFKKKIELLIKNNLFFQRIYSFFGSLFFRFIGLFVRQNKKLIVFSSYSGDSISDSPKVIYEKIIAEYPGFECIWAVKNKDKYKSTEFHCVEIDSMKYFITCLKARYWVTNVNIERGLHFKKRKTFYLNTWHSTTVKTIGNQVKHRRDYNFKNMDLLCSDGQFMTNIFIKYFNANPNSVFECGRPREDELFEKNSFDEKNKNRLSLGIPEDAFVVLYAPTWREKSGTDNTIDISLDFDNVLSRLGDKTYILFRAHHITTETHGIRFNNRIIDTSDVLNVNKLYFAADVLISDFSSCFFDFALLNKPIICFAKDYEEYNKSRGLCIDLINEFPGGVLNSEDKLIELLIRIKGDGLFYKNEQDRFIKRYVSRKNESATVFCVKKMLEKYE